MTKINIKTQNNENNGLPQVVLLDTAAATDACLLKQQLKSAGYNLCSVLYSFTDAYIYAHSADYLIVLDSSNCGAQVENLLLSNLNFKDCIVLSDVLCNGIGFNYLPMYMLVQPTGNLGQSYNSQKLYDAIIAAMQLVCSPHKCLLNLSWQLHKTVCGQLLKSLGFNVQHKGSKQLLSASYACVFNKNANLYTTIYPFVATNFACSVEAIERNIRSAINVAVPSKPENKAMLRVFLKTYNLSSTDVEPIIAAIAAKKNKSVIYSISQFLWNHIY